jgi:glycosyltransferase involved in cell wall biosynthesis
MTKRKLESTERFKVCMFVFNNFTHDARVFKEASTLAEMDRVEVRVVAMQDARTLAVERRNGFDILRVALFPLHLRMMSWFRPAANQSPGAAPESATVMGHAGRPVTSPAHQTEVPEGSLVALVQPGDCGQAAETSAAAVPFDSGASSHDDTLPLDPHIVPDACGHVQSEDALEEVHPSHCRGQATAIMARNDNLARVIPIKFYILSNTLSYKVKRLILLSIRKVKRLILLILRAPRTILLKAIKIGLMPMHRLLSFWDYYIQAYILVSQSPADAYHAHDLNTLPVAWYAARKHKARLVYDSHELYVERNRKNPHGHVGKFFLKCIERFLIRRCDAVITVNESIAQELARRYKIPVPTVLMNTPAKSAIRQDSSPDRLRSAVGIDAQHKILLYCGSFTFNRGLEKLIQSLVHLTDCHLVMMGYGAADYKAELACVAQACGVAGRLSFFGPVPSDEVPQYAAGADLGVAPIENVCLSYYFCSPNKVFEYIAAGIPVIASDFPELRKVIDTFGIGATFNPDDPRDIARSARDILDNPSLRQEMKPKAAAAAEAFNWENESVKLRTLYQEFLTTP